MAKRGKVFAALMAAGAVLKRSKRHLVYELPNGQNVTLAKTPSDFRADLNKLRDIRHAIGDVQKAPPGPPKPKRLKPGRAEVPWQGFSPMALAVKESGILAAATEKELRWEILHLEEQLSRREAVIEQLEGLWIVRGYRWGQRLWVRMRGPDQGLWGGSTGGWE